MRGRVPDELHHGNIGCENENDSKKQEVVLGGQGFTMP